MSKNTRSIRLEDDDKFMLEEKFSTVQAFFDLALELEKEGLIDLLLKKRKEHLKALKL
tara:strand:+ start:213 stop:386 length:174 start_codon:yes stop_codon:yes gene_type:complete